MAYNAFHNDFRVIVHIKCGQQFKFIYNGSYVVSNDYKIENDKNGNINNSYLLNELYQQLPKCRYICLEALRNMEEQFQVYTIPEIIKKIDSDIPSNISTYSTCPEQSINDSSDEISRIMSPPSPRTIRPSFHKPNCVESTDNAILKTWRFVSSFAEFKRDDKCATEDACFTIDKALGVSDGVGGWAEYGIDPGEFSRSLMKECKSSFLKYFNGENRESICSADPLYILSNAYSAISSYGSATALLVTLNNDQLLCCNIGDSGFLVIRFMNNSPFIIEKSTPQQHDFNVPFQLARIPSLAKIEDIASKSKNGYKIINKIRNGNFCQDAPEHSDFYLVSNIKQNDIVVLATDGSIII